MKLVGVSQQQAEITTALGRLLQKSYRFQQKNICHFYGSKGENWGGMVNSSVKNRHEVTVMKRLWIFPCSSYPVVSAFQFRWHDGPLHEMEIIGWYTEPIGGPAIRGFTSPSEVMQRRAAPGKAISFHPLLKPEETTEGGLERLQTLIWRLRR